MHHGTSPRIVLEVGVDGACFWGRKKKQSPCERGTFTLLMLLLSVRYGRLGLLLYVGRYARVSVGLAWSGYGDDIKKTSMLLTEVSTHLRRAVRSVTNYSII